MGNFALAHVVAGHTLHRLVRVSDAAAHYKAALMLQPDCLPALLAVGDLRFDRGEVVQARRAYAHAAIRCPQSASPFVHLARLHQHEGKDWKADEMANRALFLNPYDAEALEADAVLRLAKGELHEAIEGLEAALAARNAPPHGSERWKRWVCESRVSTECSCRQEAIRLYAVAADCRTSSPIALTGLGYMELISRWESAHGLFEAALMVLNADEALLLEASNLDGKLLSLSPKAVLGEMQALADEAGNVASGATSKVLAASAASFDKHRIGGSGSERASSLFTSGVNHGSLARARQLRGRALVSAGV